MQRRDWVEAHHAGRLPKEQLRCDTGPGRSVDLSTESSQPHTGPARDPHPAVDDGRHQHHPARRPRVRYHRRNLHGRQPAAVEHEQRHGLGTGSGIGGRRERRRGRRGSWSFQVTLDRAATKKREPGPRNQRRHRHRGSRLRVGQRNALLQHRRPDEVHHRERARRRPQRGL